MPRILGDGKEKEEDGGVLNGDSDHSKVKPLSDSYLLVQLGDDANSVSCVEVVQVGDKLAHIDHQGYKGVIESSWKCSFLRDCGFERGEEGRKEHSDLPHINGHVKSAGVMVDGRWR